MLSIQNSGVRLCDGLTRREALRVGGLGFTGLLWSDWLRAAPRNRSGPRRTAPAGPGRASSCSTTAARRTSTSGI